MAQNINFYDTRPRTGDLFLVKLMYHKTTEIIMLQHDIPGDVILQSWQKHTLLEHLIIRIVTQHHKKLYKQKPSLFNFECIC